MRGRKVISVLAGLLIVATIAVLVSQNAEAQRRRRRAAAASDISIDVCMQTVNPIKPNPVMQLGRSPGTSRPSTCFG